MNVYQPNGGGKQSIMVFMRLAIADAIRAGRKPRRWEISPRGFDQLRYEVHPNMGLDFTDAKDPFKRFMGVPIMEVREDGVKCALIVDEVKR